MIQLLASLLPVLPQESPYTHDLSQGCIVYATLADGTGTGLSSMGAWLSVESWCGGIIGTPPPCIVQAELFFQGVNQDEVRNWSTHDLLETYAILDTDGDGLIEIGEPTPAALAGESPVLAQAFVNRTARLLLLEMTDADQDGTVTEAEREVVIDQWSAAKNKSPLAREWILAAEQQTVGRWSAISPGASFAAFAANLDHEQDGDRIDWLRMEGWFHGQDANGDKVLDAQELYAPGPQGTSDGANVAAKDPIARRVNAWALANGASRSLRCGDVDGAVQRLIGLAWLSPESFCVEGPEGVTAIDTAKQLLLIALPSESKPLLTALQLLRIELE